MTYAPATEDDVRLIDCRGCGTELAGPSMADADLGMLSGTVRSRIPPFPAATCATTGFAWCRACVVRGVGERAG